MKRNIFLTTSAIVLMVLTLAILPVHAGEITDRSLTLSSSEPSSQANYTFNLSVDSSNVIRSFRVRICDEASGACVVPEGFNGGAANLINQPSGFGDNSGWNVDTDDADLLRMNNQNNMLPPDSSQTVTFGNVINPSGSNTTFYARITTYENDDYTGVIDEGVVASSTAETINVKGFVPPILTFCVGIKIPGDCSTASGHHIDMGELRPGSTATGTSQMRASTNAGDGYVVTVNGNTLASGSNTINRLNSPVSSQAGVSQFGMNLRNNSRPDVGSNTEGDGDGSATDDYAAANKFTFNDGDVIAEAPGATHFNTFTVSYITNVDRRQAAGRYKTTLTYIVTASF